MHTSTAKLDEDLRLETGNGGSAVDHVLAELRAMIADGGLKVGDRLPTERELCERFSASRNTVREAMRMLKAFGVVEVRPKVGATIVDQRMNRAFDLFSFNVTEISRQTFDDIQGFRELIETGAVMQIFDAATAAHAPRGSSSRPSLDFLSDASPPAMIPTIRPGSIWNVGGASDASNTPNRPLVPAPT